MLMVRFIVSSTAGTFSIDTSTASGIGRSSSWSWTHDPAIVS